MERYNNSLIRKYRNLQNRIASGHDESEQIRELEELQRSLAERIRKMERVARHGQENETG